MVDDVGDLGIILEIIGRRICDVVTLVVMALRFFGLRRVAVVRRQRYSIYSQNREMHSECHKNSNGNFDVVHSKIVTLSYLRFQNCYFVVSSLEAGASPMAKNESISHAAISVSL